MDQTFTLRSPTWDDLPAITELIVATDRDERGESDFSLEDMLMGWKRPSFDPTSDAWVAIAQDGSIVGYAEVFNRNAYVVLEGDGYVHPAWHGKGIGTTQLRRLEQRARELMQRAPEGAQVVLRNGMSAADQGARQLHAHEGYQPVRYFWRMEIQMQSPPDAPRWPAGIEVRNLQPGQEERRVFNALEEAFQDHWGSAPWDFETWLMRRTESDGFDPSLWFLAMAGEQIAGVSICCYRMENGWVSQLAVRRPWRRLGLGLALLNRSLGEFYSRGTRLVGLGVDATNTTGATRLYESAGMHVAHEYVVYQKELRPGTSIE